MTVAEIKAKLPEADVYELNESSRYIVVLDRSLIRAKEVEDMANGRVFPKNTAFIHVDNPDEAIRLFEIKEQ